MDSPNVPALSAQQSYLHLNPVIEKLSQGKHVFGVSTSDFSLQNARSLARDPDIDFVYLDMEHGAMRFDQRDAAAGREHRAHDAIHASQGFDDPDPTTSPRYRRSRAAVLGHIDAAGLTTDSMRVVSSPSARLPAVSSPDFFPPIYLVSRQPLYCAPSDLERIRI